MKKTISEVSIIVLILALLISAFTVPLSAATDYSQVIDVTWQYPTAIKAVEQRTKEFVISTATDKGRINNFYISFPKDGGIRIRMDEKGYFDSSEYSDISFSEDGSSIIMTAGGSTAELGMLSRERYRLRAGKYGRPVPVYIRAYLVGYFFRLSAMDGG